MSSLSKHLKTAALNMLTALSSPSGKHARLSIVIYHRMPLEPDELLHGQEDAQTFETQIRYLSGHFNILPLHEAMQRLQDGTLPSRAACITFDDGYANNAEVALPILQKYGASATFFITTGVINGGMMWNDKVIELIRRAPGDVIDLSKIGLGKHEISTMALRRKTLFTLIDKLKYLPQQEKHAQLEQLCHLIPVALPEDMMLTTNQIRKLHNAGMEIGGHTVSHPILARLDHDAAYTEIENGKKALEDIIQSPVRLFAYPNGKPERDYLPEHVAMLKKIGFDAAVSTSWGAARRNTDIYQLPRFTPWDKNRVRFILRMNQNLLRTAHTCQS